MATRHQVRGIKPTGIFANGILVLLAFASVATAAAAAPLTLNEATFEAMQNNPQIQKARAEADAAGARKLEALSAYLPHLDVTGMHIFSAKYEVLNVNFAGSVIAFPEGFPQTSADITASIMFFDGLGAWNRWKAAQNGSDAAELDLKNNEFKLQKEVKRRFLRALASQELASVADHNIQTLNDHLKLANATARAGFGTRFDALRISAQLEEAQAEKVLADDNVVIARRELYQAMGVENDDGRVLAGKLIEPDEKRVPSNLTADITTRDDYRALLKRHEAASKMVSAAGSAWWPMISFFATDTYYKFGSFDPAILPSDFQQAYTVGLRLKWDIFDGGASIAKREEAAATERQAEQSRRAALMQAGNDFELWKRRYFYNSSLYRARVRNIEKSEESVRLAKAALKAGTRTHTEVLDAELDLFRSRAGAVTAELDSAEALLNLEVALGRDL